MSDTVGLSGLGLELGRLFRPHGNGRTSEVSLALEDVRVRRRMAEARGSSYEAAGRLWVKEIDRQLVPDLPQDLSLCLHAVSSTDPPYPQLPAIVSPVTLPSDLSFRRPRGGKAKHPDSATPV